jgi:hypothetical protein
MVKGVGVSTFFRAKNGAACHCYKQAQVEPQYKNSIYLYDLYDCRHSVGGVEGEHLLEKLGGWMVEGNLDN